MSRSGYERCKCRLAPGERGDVRIDRVRVSREMAARHPESLLPGPVTRLWIGTAMVMSDGYGEYVEHEEAIRRARGRVLVHGLGLGCYLRGILAKRSVTSVEVVERNPDVIALVWPEFAPDARCRVIEADAFEQARQWPRGSYWDCVWHDVWSSKDLDYLPQYHFLHRSFARRCRWQGSWAYGELLAKRRRGEISQRALEERLSAEFGFEVRISDGIPSWA